jgi:hypothetical protein
MPEKFDAGKAVKRKIVETGLVASLNRNTEKLSSLQESIDGMLGAQAERIEGMLRSHHAAMERMRTIQSNDLDRELEQMRLGRLEMEQGRHALNANTEAMKGLAEAIESIIEEVRGRG